MATLRAVASGPDAAWWAVEDDLDRPLERYVVSTAASREILNRPEIAGVAYTEGLRRALAAALASAPFEDAIRAVGDERTCVLHVLRGGLNFGLREALYDAYGFSLQPSAFLSSQRRRDANGTWSIHEDLYKKVDVPDGGVVIVGDVVATGVTIRHAMRVLQDHLQREARHIRRLVFFTIGGARIEEALTACDPAFRRASPAWEGATVVYLEGRFTLVDEAMRTPLAIPGTDLIRKDALMAPPFTASQDEDVARVLERCVIYDAGSRAFDVASHRADLFWYWQDLREVARDGTTLEKALADRWTGTHPKATALDSLALEALCNDRLAQLGPIQRAWSRK